VKKRPLAMILSPISRLIPITNVYSAIYNHHVTDVSLDINHNTTDTTTYNDITATVFVWKRVKLSCPRAQEDDRQTVMRDETVVAETWSVPLVMTRLRDVSNIIEMHDSVVMTIITQSRYVTRLSSLLRYIHTHQMPPLTVTYRLIIISSVTTILRVPQPPHQPAKLKPSYDPQQTWPQPR